MISARRNDYDASGITIPVSVNRHIKFTFDRPASVFPTEIQYDFSLSSDVDGILTITQTTRPIFPNVDSRIACVRCFPAKLELDDGETKSTTIRFDPGRDWIFFGLQSLFTFSRYYTTI